MRSRFLKTALLSAAALGAVTLGGVGSARAGIFSSVAVQVWTGTGDCTNSPTTCVADTATLTSQHPPFPDATFTYTGPIDFSNISHNNSANTFLNFFDSYNGTTTTTNYATLISGFISPSNAYANKNAFLTALMSTPGQTTPTSVNTIMQISGTYSALAGTPISITHDDGASFYTNGSFTALLSSPGPTTSIVTSGGLTPGGSGVPFTLVYNESNGDPAVLQTSVPEPGSLVLLGTGLLALSFVARRRRTA